MYVIVVGYEDYVSLNLRIDSVNIIDATAHKLKSDLMRGNLSQLSVLPLNKQLLLGTDSGSIHLVC